MDDLRSPLPKYDDVGERRGRACPDEQRAYRRLEV